jgi:hypothetical protein
VQALGVGELELLDHLPQPLVVAQLRLDPQRELELLAREDPLSDQRLADADAVEGPCVVGSGLGVRALGRLCVRRFRLHDPATPPPSCRAAFAALR